LTLLSTEALHGVDLSPFYPNPTRQTSSHPGCNAALAGEMETQAKTKSEEVPTLSKTERVGHPRVSTGLRVCYRPGDVFH
jgi:hypothetical protein